jgi:hypothetical protein
LHKAGQHRWRGEHRQPRIARDRVDYGIDIEMRQHHLMAAAQYMRQCVKTGAM